VIAYTLRRGVIKSKESSKKVTVTFAIDEKIISELRNDAELNGISLNSKINNILTKYAIFYKHAEEIGCSIWPPSLFSAFLELLDESKVVEVITNTGTDAVLSFFKHNNIPLNKETLIKYGYHGIALWAGQYAFFSHYVDNEGYTCLVMDHKSGIRWSRILANMHITFIENLLQLPAKTITITSTTVVLRILDR
jgi:hypothetical protein